MSADLLRHSKPLFSIKPGEWVTLARGVHSLFGPNEEGMLAADYKRLFVTFELDEVTDGLGVHLRLLHKQIYKEGPPFDYVRAGQVTMRQNGQYVFDAKIKAPMITFELEVFSPSAKIRAFINMR